MTDTAVLQLTAVNSAKLLWKQIITKYTKCKFYSQEQWVKETILKPTASHMINAMELNFTEFFQNMGMDVNPVDGSLDGVPEMYGAMTFLKSVSPQIFNLLRFLNR